MTRYHPTRTFALCALAVASVTSQSARAADWSDTSIGYRTGSTYAEPFNSKDISKDIINFTHVSGYKYGSNFFNVDLLLSDSNDPSSAGAGTGAHEVYAVYRHTLDMSKVLGTELKFGPFRGVGFVGGFDFNTKTDAGYNSKKRMLVAGPQLSVDVPGFFNIALLVLWESNAPYSTFSGKATPRYSYDVHPMLNAVWSIPFNVGVPLAFEGFANFIASKGKNEFGANTAAETNIDMQIMYDLGSNMGAKPNTFKVGFEYQYWNNKFGNNADGPAGKGASAKTPMLRVEYHF